jgi:hypothetical protein
MRRPIADRNMPIAIALSHLPDSNEGRSEYARIRPRAKPSSPRPIDGSALTTPVGGAAQNISHHQPWSGTDHSAGVG